MFSRTFLIASLVVATIGAPFVKRQLVGQVLVEVQNGGIPGNATLDNARILQNECNIEVGPDDSAFLIARAFLRNAAPGSTAAENGLCGRFDATVFALDESGVILDTTKSFLAPVGICEECDAGSVILNSKAFGEIGGNPAVGVIPNVFPRFG
ncbi:hypothetical protein MPER_07411 [Moniliophthora perniciosa FA553]|nr:hypothetical protein MPER_07411 [Moniliophthora perniciosa FA553]